MISQMIRTLSFLIKVWLCFSNSPYSKRYENEIFFVPLLMWLYENKEIRQLDDLPTGTYGFIYIIKNLSKNKSYIGKKNLFFERKTALGKKEIAALENKRLKKWKIVTKESDWLNYNGSCKELIDDIASGDIIEKTIIRLAFSKRELTYLEVKYLFQYEVLESEDYYNQNIESRFFKGNLK